MDKALILMTRVPLPGNTKTRLETHLTPEQCAALHTCFIKDIYSSASKTGADIFVYYTPEKHGSIIEQILGEDISLHLQIGDNLGEKMYSAIENCLALGYEKCILIGTDIPTIRADMIVGAFQALDSKDIVIGPTIDGGYYLIGMTRAVKEVFSNMFYGTQKVYEKTITNIITLGISFKSIDSWYDIDTFHDLQYLIKNIKENKNNIPDHTYKYLHQLGMIEMGTL